MLVWYTNIYINVNITGIQVKDNENELYYLQLFYKSRIIPRLNMCVYNTKKKIKMNYRSQDKK